jgi:signal transduction histidine kinase
VSPRRIVPVDRGRSTSRRRAGKNLRERLREAEETIEAIRMGRVDAFVVSGPDGEQTRTIEGATHPYFVLLNAMDDGALLLGPRGEILFGNLSFAELAGAPIEKLRATPLQRLVVPAERPVLERLMRAELRRLERPGRPERPGRDRAHEFTLGTGAKAVRPVAIALSALPLGTYQGITGSTSRDYGVLMAIVTDLTRPKAEEATRAELLGRLISAEDDERRRIALELHDETGQSLTALLVGLRSIAEMPAASEVHSAALRLRAIARRMMDDLGRLVRGLHPAVLDDKGLAAAAKGFLSDYANSFGTRIRLATRGLDSPRLSPLVAATAYRILQEALTNVARHARATTIDVSMRRNRGAIEVSVRDDGIGFDAAGMPGAAARLGLRGMRERVMLLGGSLELESGAGNGTLIRVRIPVAGRWSVRSSRPAAGSGGVGRGKAP